MGRELSFSASRSGYLVSVLSNLPGSNDRYHSHPVLPRFPTRINRNPSKRVVVQDVTQPAQVPVNQAECPQYP